jgi:hypothetical protein
MHVIVPYDGEQLTIICDFFLDIVVTQKLKKKENIARGRYS